MAQGEQAAVPPEHRAGVVALGGHGRDLVGADSHVIRSTSRQAVSGFVDGAASRDRQRLGSPACY
jgi:hypothetical protein